MKERIKYWIILFVFLCLELAAFFVGGKAFYSTPVEISLVEDAPVIYWTPFLPQHGWITQQQWFEAEGNYLNRITFTVMPLEKNDGGFTAEVQDEKGARIAAQHYAGEELSEGIFELEIDRALTRGRRYCFTVIADNEQTGWAVPYLYVPSGELSHWEEASLDGAPMGGGLHYLFLTFFFARTSWIAVCLHIAGAVGGAAYLLFFPSLKNGKAYIADAAVLCAAGVCAVGQFFLCKNYFLSRALLLCAPTVSLVLFAFFRLMKNKYTRKWFRLSFHSFKTYAFLAAATLTGLMILYSIRRSEVASITGYFSLAAVALLLFLFFGIFETPGTDRICARFPWVVYGAVSILIFLQMEIANGNSLRRMLFGLAVWNVLTIFVIFAGIWAFCGNFRIAGLAGTLLFAVWGFANYLTVEFRGYAIAPSDLMSVGSALNVLGGYHIHLQMKLTAFFALVFLEWILLFRIPYTANGKKQILQRAAALMCVVVFFWQGYFGRLDPVDMSMGIINMQTAYDLQGYVAVSIARIRQLFAVFPAGYTPAEVQLLHEKEQAQTTSLQTDPESRPNIILILDESWFDWRQVTEFETDRPVMPYIDSMENCIRGFAVVPMIGGGTSLSEYELLTSNSLSMMPEITPFTQRNLEGSYSVVSYLNDLGYETTALHPYIRTTYNRTIVYPQLGFDHISFLGDDLWKNASLLRLFVSDDSAFGAIKTLFDEKDANTPALIYLLTMQNHAEYNATVKNGGDYRMERAYEINLLSGFNQCKGAAEEYLSLVRYTDAAFEGLIGYFENCSEPTIVCMVGDHAPALRAEIESPYEDYEWSRRQRGTPFVIWANYPIESYDAGYIGMVQLVPLLMKTAGLPLSPYYQTILDLGAEYPVIGAAFYRDADGNYGDYTYAKEIPQSELLRQYVYFEYNSLLMKEKRVEDLFLPG